MKRVTLIAALLFAAEILLIAQNATDNYDVFRFPSYQPEEYQPTIYSPKRYLAARKPREYVRPNIAYDINTLRQFIKDSNKNPKVQMMFIGAFDDYVNLAAKTIQKGKAIPTWNKKLQSNYNHDYFMLSHFLYQKDSSRKCSLYASFVRDSISRRDAFIKDSLSFRDTFLRDSLDKRNRFLRDSLHQRKRFVEDSLYRAEFRLKNNYDNVVFASPHGEPVLCYRSGKLIKGKIYDSLGRLIEVWENGQCYQKYSYDSHGRIRKQWEKDLLVHNYGYGEGFVVDSVACTKTYSNGDMDYYDSHNRVVRKIHYNDYGWEMIDEKYIYINGERVSYYISKVKGEEKKTVKREYYSTGWVKSEKEYKNGKINFEEYYSYYPDGTKKTETSYYYYDGYSKKYVCTYYSDGTRNMMYEYEKRNSRDYILRESDENHGSYRRVKHYDPYGNLEYSEIRY